MYTTLEVIVKMTNNKLESMNILMMVDTVKNYVFFLRVMVGWCVFVNRGGVCTIVVNLLKK